MPHERFEAQARLLLRVLPYVADESCFALKGGTAINFFDRALPRLSVDIDLVFLPITDRKTAVAEIKAALQRISRAIQKGLQGSLVDENMSADGTRLVVRHGAAQVKIEVTPVLRGTVHPPVTRKVHAVVEERFGFAEIQVVSFADLYAGKLVAALDRQHPRDLFDVHHLLAKEGIDTLLFYTFLVYIVSHNRPAHEVIVPNQKDITRAFEREFVGMAVDELALTDLVQARETLIAQVRSLMDDKARHFLRAFHKLEPDWSVLGFPGIDQLPSVRWKLENLHRLQNENAKKYRMLLAMLDDLLEK